MMILCNISIFGGGTIEVDSKSMCNYVNYHAVMFVLCGIFSMMMMFLTCLCPVCCGPAVETDGCVMWAVVFFLLMAGFEGSIVMCIILEYVLLIFLCLSKIPGYFRRRHLAKVHPITAVVKEEVVAVGIPIPSTRAVAAVEVVAAGVVVVETSSSCCGVV